MADSTSTDVVVIGGGISGLASAHYLTKRGLDVRVLEKTARTGGTILTKRVDGFLVDCGPNSALDTTPLLSGLFSELGIENQREFANDEAKNRYVVKNGRLIALPMTPPAFLKTRLFSAGAKLRLLREPFIPPSPPGADESLAHFVVRRLGREMLDYAINPFVSGVYAGRPEDLSVRAGFPKLFELEQKYGSLIKGSVKGRKERRRSGETSKQSARLFSFEEGMQTLVDALARNLDGRVHTQARIGAIEKTRDGFEVVAGPEGEPRVFRCRSLVLAVPAFAVGELPFRFDCPLASSLERIPYPPVNMVFFGYRTPPTARPLDGFGFLVPEREGRRILGTIWTSTLFDHRTPEGGVAFTTFIGGSRQPEVAGLNDDEIASLVLKELSELIGVSGPPDTIVIQRWDRAIPQYNVGHEALLDGVKAVEQAHPRLHVTGNFRGGVSVSDCVRQAYRLGETLPETLGS